jgi:hypothetical protein
MIVVTVLIQIWFLTYISKEWLGQNKYIMDKDE